MISKKELGGMRQDAEEARNILNRGDLSARLRHKTNTEPTKILALLDMIDTLEAEQELLYKAIADAVPVEDWTNPEKGITELEAHINALKGKPKTKNPPLRKSGGRVIILFGDRDTIEKSLPTNHSMPVIETRFGGSSLAYRTMWMARDLSAQCNTPALVIMPKPTESHRPIGRHNIQGSSVYGYEADDVIEFTEEDGFKVHKKSYRFTSLPFTLSDSPRD